MYTVQARNSKRVWDSRSNDLYYLEFFSSFTLYSTMRCCSLFYRRRRWPLYPYPIHLVPVTYFTKMRSICFNYFYIYIYIFFVLFFFFINIFVKIRVNMMIMILCVLLLLLSANNFREKNADRFEICSARILAEGAVYCRRVHSCTHRETRLKTRSNLI